ncbi:MAG: hypothetical protein JKY56_04035 [Kofleriaceae bacterium]|nr:hypothetical protein [Kofleriaceae bacterium]
MTLQADRRLEWAVGKVADDKAAWMYGEYFAEIGPVLAEYDNQQAASFAVVATNVKGVQPTAGVFSTWPSAEARVGFHEDPRFTKVQPARDAAMEMFSFGNSIESMDEVITLNTDSDYAVIIAKSYPLSAAPIFRLPLSKDSPEQTYAGKSFSLLPWNAEVEQLMTSSADGVEVYRVRFNPAAQ